MKITDSEAHVWIVDLDPSTERTAFLEGLLTADELARADRFVTVELRRRYIVARGTLRELLGRATKTPPDELRLRYETWGKPQLHLPPLPTPLHFNVSHSADVGLIGMSADTIGVDVEKIDRSGNYRGIATQVLSPTEKRAWDELPAKEQEQEILRLWVCKESLLKAMGLGIADALPKTAYPIPVPQQDVFAPLRIAPELQLNLDEGESCQLNAWLMPATWRTQWIESRPDCLAAITMRDTVDKVHLHWDFHEHPA